MDMYVLYLLQISIIEFPPVHYELISIFYLLAIFFPFSLPLPFSLSFLPPFLSFFLSSPSVSPTPSPLSSLPPSLPLFFLPFPSFFPLYLDVICARFPNLVIYYFAKVRRYTVAITIICPVWNKPQVTLSQS